MSTPNPNKPRRHFSRRALLQGLGAGAALAPFVPLLEVQAAEGPPLRLLLMFSANGTIRDAWLPQGSESDFTLGPILSSLEPVKDQIIVIDGLKFPSGGPGNRHMQGPSKFACGSALLDGDFGGGGGASSGWGGGTSIDQAYAAEVGAQTPFKSLELGVRVSGSNVRHRLSYSGPDQPIPPESDPEEVFDRLFADFSQEETAEIARLRAQRQSILGAVQSQTDAIRARVGRDDRDKIDAHLEGLSEIERRLDLEVGVGEACEVPDPVGSLEHMSTSNYPEVTRLQMDLLTMAFACDLTRSASFMWNGSTSPQTFPWLDISESHHDLSHEGDSNAGAQNKLVKINTWYAEQFSYLVQRMAEIPEGDGTLLDNTVILWGNELGKGNNHSHSNIPLVIAGGRNAGLQLGRFLRYDGVEHNRLLVSVLNALGLDIDQYGDLDEGSGSLPGF
ncbi:MAG: DUF1552 domain-containing protein [Myxococcota bacterium]